MKWKSLRKRKNRCRRVGLKNGTMTRFSIILYGFLEVNIFILFIRTPEQNLTDGGVRSMIRPHKSRVVLLLGIIVLIRERCLPMRPAFIPLLGIGINMVDSRYTEGAHGGNTAMEIATVGYGANNWSDFSHNTQYRERGELFIGTYDRTLSKTNLGT